MKRASPYVAILSIISFVVFGFYIYYLKYLSKQIVSNWVKIEQVNIQQGNLFSSVAAGNRILMSSGSIKAIMLYDSQNGITNEMASYGEYQYIPRLPEIAPGTIKSQLVGPYSVHTFVRFAERPNLVAALLIESPDSAVVFLFMLGVLTVIVTGFAIFILSLERKEEAKRLMLVQGALDDLLAEVSPRQSIIDQMPPLLAHWEAMKSTITLIKAKFEAGARDRIVAQTSAMITHDMRAPIGTFERLLFTNPEDLPGMMPAVRESVNRLYQMADSLRRGEIENIVRQIWTDLDFSFGYESLLGKAKARGVDLQVPADVLRHIYIDQSKVERAWINLASNAIDFAKSKVRVEVDIQESALTLRVMDDGPGVPEDFVPKLFSRGATSGKQDGTGLGLAYVRQVAQGHGGDVTYSRSGNWTLFELRLPNTSASAIDDKGFVSQTQEEKGPLVVRQVAICLKPDDLNQSILREISNFQSTEYTFSSLRDGALIVVSNDEDIMMEVLELDEVEYFSLAQYKHDRGMMMEILKRKFALS